jgi:MoaA/NifB/PqqE/SkfB family radical SAM enzyme
MRRFYIQWHIIDRCNLRCKHCYQDNFSSKRELDIYGLREVADNLISTMEKWGAKLDIAITGGEPLLKKEIFELISYLNNSNSIGNLSIITNGTILSDFLEELEKFKKLKEIKISLDGVSDETNDWIRGKGTFSEAMENVRKAKGRKIPLILMFTVMKNNLADIESLPEFAKEKGFKGLIIERFFPLGTGKNIEDNVLSGNEFLNVWLTILEKFGYSAKKEELIKFRAIKVLFFKERVKIFGSECIVGKDGIAILPDGTVLPCRRFHLPIGNLLKKSLFEIWRESEVLNLLRKKSNLKGICGKCDIEDCIGCRAMCYCLTGDYLQEDPHCWLGKTKLI